MRRGAWFPLLAMLFIGAVAPTYAVAEVVSDDFSVTSGGSLLLKGREAQTGEIWSVGVNGPVIDPARGAITHPGGYGGGYGFLSLPSVPLHLRATFQFTASNATFVLAAGQIGKPNYLHPQVGIRSVNWLASVEGVGTLVNIFGASAFWTWPDLALGEEYSFEYWLNWGGDPTAMRVKDPTGEERTLFSDHLPTVLRAASGLTIQPTNTSSFVKTVEAEYATVSSVPEPSTYALLALGLGALALTRHQRARQEP